MATYLYNKRTKERSRELKPNEVEGLVLEMAGGGHTVAQTTKAMTMVAEFNDKGSTSTKRYRLYTE